MRRRWIRRAWPQKVRPRLTLLYAALFLLGGSVLLGLTYGLVAQSLPVHQRHVSRQVSQAEQKIRLACRQADSDPPALPSVIRECKAAFSAGAQAASTSQRDRTLHSLLLFSLAGLGGLTIVSGGLGWVVAGRVLRPVQAITATARRASGQHLGERIALGGARDELRELADTFDGMLDRLDRAFDTQRRFVANASHELRTPLTLMRTAIDVTLAKPSRTPGQLEMMAVRVRRSVERAESMIDALLTLAVSDQATAGHDPLDLATAAEDALDAAAAGIARLGLRVEARLETADAVGDLRLVERLVANLVDNAVRHNAPDGWIRLRTGRDDSAAFLHIANSGPAVPGDALPALFEPFRRMAERTGAGDGVGLGLSIARSICTAHGASIAVLAPPEGGLDIRVTFPPSG